MKLLPIDHDPFRGGEVEDLAPTTEPQREVLAAAALDPVANTAYNEAVSLRIEGDCDDAELESALRLIHRRHDALRSVFTPDLAALCVLSGAELAYERREVSVADEAGRERAVRGLWRELVARPLSIYEGPLFRAVLLRFDPRRAELVLLAHHAVCDGWSLHCILRELEIALGGGDGEELVSASSFLAFARERASRSEGADEAHWLARFVDHPEPVDLPVDRPRRPRRSFDATRIDHELDAAVVRAVRRTAAAQRASHVHVFVAGIAALLQRLGAGDEAILAMPLARQALERRPALVGHCVQVLPLRLHCAGERSFATLVDEARSSVLEAAEHFDCTFGSLVRRLGYSGDASRVPLAPVLVNVDRPLEPMRFGAAEVFVRSVPRVAEGFELFFNLVPVGEGYVLELTYNTELFEESTARLWIRSWERLLVEGAAAPEVSIETLSLITSPTEVAMVEGPVLSSVPSSWLASFLTHARARSEHPAVVDGEGALAYAGLAERGQRLARELIGRGVQYGAIVATFLPRSRELLVALLGIQHAGAVYLPLDPDQPLPRLRAMLEDSGASWIVADGALPPELDLPGLAVIHPRPENSAGDAQDLPLPAARDCAYLIYTSGTTGRPKGVRVSHGALANALESFRARPGLSADDVLLAVTTVGFDISFLELLLPLIAGATVVVPPREEVEDPHVLAHLLERHRVTALQATPAHWRMLVDSGWQGSERLVGICGGERLREDLAAALLSRLRALWNAYGPTETTIWSSLAEVRDPARAALIGTPIAHTTIQILDRRGALLPRGVPGEICIGGAGVAEGYHQRAQLTAQSFVDHLELGRIYRTGDRGRVRHDGVLECMGRLDRQVKLNGYRIELGEIEVALGKHASVADAAVSLEPGVDGSARLVGHVVGRGERLDFEALEHHLRSELPLYMIPRQWVSLPALPRLSNGKLDHRRLSAGTRVEVPLVPEGDEEPKSELEQRIRDAMARLTRSSAFGVHTDFFRAGGHSLLAAQLTSELNRELACGLSMRDVFEAPTPRLLAAVVVDGRRPRGAALEIGRRTERRVGPTTALQERIWFLEQMLEGLPTYHLPSAHRLRGPLDVPAMHRALLAVIERQAVLRTTFERLGGEVVQRVHPRLPPELEAGLLPLEDLTPLDPQEGEAELARRIEACIAEPFALGRLPLFRLRLFRLGGEEHVLFFMAHHMIWDGWSFDILYRELSAAYSACAAGGVASFPPLAIEHIDFAAWSRARSDSSEVSRQTAHWVERFRGFAPLPALRATGVAPASRFGEGGTEWLRIDPERTRALRALARERGTTPFVVTLAVYALLLREYSGYDILVLGIPSRGREVDGLDDLMGCCNNLLPLVVTFGEEDTVEVLLSRTKHSLLESLATPDVLLEQIAERCNDARSVLYQALFSFQDVRHRVGSWGALRHERYEVFARGASEDLGLWLAESEQELHGGMTYHLGRFDADTVRRLGRRYLELLDQVLSAPETRLGALCDAGIWSSDAATAFQPSPSSKAIATGEAGTESAALARRDYELVLEQIWCRVLGLASIDPREDFFALGGNSLRAIEVVRQLERSSGFVLELGSIFQRPTIAGLAELLLHGGTRPRSLRIPLQAEGAGTPLFCLLGIWIYRDLAKVLGSESPVYGIYVPEERDLVARLEDDAEFLVSIDGFASAYLEAVRESYPTGPYRLAGISFGGVIAMEVARRLVAEGAEVERVVLLDTMLPDSYRRRLWRAVAGRAKRGVTALLRQARRTLGGARRDARPGSELPLQLDPAFARACESATRAWTKTLGPVTWPVTLVRATDSSAWGRGYVFESDHGWGRLVGPALEIVEQRGDHLGILRPGSVEELGTKLRRILERPPHAGHG
jgi:amino acid adenylation domain-containing protein